MPVAHNHLSYVKASRPDWPRGLNFGLGLASVLLTWPRKCAIQCKTILVVSILWLYHCNIHYKDVVKHSNVGHNSCMCSWHCHHVFLFRNIYMWLASTLASAFKTWPWPQPCGSDLDLGIRVLASFNITESHTQTVGQKFNYVLLALSPCVLSTWPALTLALKTWLWSRTWRFGLILSV